MRDRLNLEIRSFNKGTSNSTPYVHIFILPSPMRGGNISHKFKKWFWWNIKEPRLTCFLWTWDKKRYRNQDKEMGKSWAFIRMMKESKWQIELGTSWDGLTSRALMRAVNEPGRGKHNLALKNLTKKAKHCGGGDKILSIGVGSIIS